MSYLPALCRAAGLPVPVPEYRFAPPRRWRFDWCWPDHKLALEINGGAFSNGRHTRGVGYINDMEKWTAAAVAGYRLLFYAPDDLGNSIADLSVIFGLSNVERVRL